MVSPGNRFLIDGAFIVERAHKVFFGAPLIAAAGKDHTFKFGCVRDFLRLRRNLGIKAGVIILGRETYSVSNRDSVLDLLVILDELRIPHVHDPLNLGLGLIGLMRCGFTHIVTADRKFLQFCTDDLVVVLPRKGKQSEWDWMSSDELKATMHIVPEDVPTYLALTDSASSAALTNIQAIRLVESYGNVDSIYRNLAQVASVPVRRKLGECEASIRRCYAENRCEHAGYPRVSPSEDDSLDDLDTADTRQVLMRYGFHSLLTLLPTPLEVPPSLPRRQPHSESYHAVVDREHLQELESIVRASSLCSIDTESDDKDPREATLLGISFSVKDGEAYFIPLDETNLKDLTRNDVLKVLRRLFSADVDFVGHNIKYDCLILRRSGVRLKHVHFDTLLAAVECHGDWPYFNLPYLCKRYLGKEIKSYSDLVTGGSTFRDLPLREMTNHACQDADMTRRLYPVLMAELQERGVTGQFFNRTMAQCLRLGNLEFNGIALNVGRIERIKERLSKQVARLRSEILAMAGKDFDLESQQALSEVLREVANLNGYIGPRRLTVSALEHLAFVEPIARLIVEVRRLRNRIARLESISAASHEGKIYPLFNQIKSRTGLLASVGPSMFDIEGVSELKSCFDRTVRDLFVNARTSLRLLAKMTKDPVLVRVTSSQSNVVAKHPLMRELDSDELLLRLAVGQSDTALSRKFLVDRFKIATMRHDLEKRYQTMFRWLNDFRRWTRTKGYATNGDLRKYFDGLKSADVAKRGQSLEYAVRWLIHY
jgi:DNA polymerase I-like protein with 3'-5' exonuclease and polymerase domains